MVAMAVPFLARSLAEGRFPLFCVNCRQIATTFPKVGSALLAGGSVVPFVAAAPAVPDFRGCEAVWRNGGHGGIRSTGQPSVARTRSLGLRQLRHKVADWRTALPADPRTGWPA